MNNIKIQGFKFNIDSLVLFETEIKKASNKLHKILQKRYKELYKEEFQFLADNTILGNINNEQMLDFENLKQVAKQNLDNKIVQSKFINNKYNFNYLGYVFADKNSLYLNTNFANIDDLKIFKDTAFEDYHILEGEENNPKDKKVDLWTSLFKIYDKNFEPMCVNLAPTNIELDINNIIFDNVKTRAEKIAKEHHLSLCLSKASIGRQIEPYELPLRVFDSLDIFKKYQDCDEYKAKYQQLLSILPDYNDKKFFEREKGEENDSEKEKM